VPESISWLEGDESMREAEIDTGTIFSGVNSNSFIFTQCPPNNLDMKRVSTGRPITKSVYEKHCLPTFKRYIFGWSNSSTMANIKGVVHL